MLMQPWQGSEADRRRVPNNLRKWTTRVDNLTKVVGNLQRVAGNLQKAATNLQRQARAPGATTVYPLEARKGRIFKT